METPEFFTPLPITMSPQTKLLTVDPSTSSSVSPDLPTTLDRINTLHRQLQQIDPPNLLAPPPPQPPYVNPKRSQQIAKMRESAQTALKKQSNTPNSGPEPTTAPQSDAVKLYSLALEMALGRPYWEPQQLLREELAAIYTARAAAFAALRAWADAYTDCRLSLEAKPQGNPGAYRVGTDALREMGRTAEAGELVRRGVAQEENTLGVLRGQVAQIPEGHPNKGGAKQSLSGFERELEGLREYARQLGVM